MVDRLSNVMKFIELDASQWKGFRDYYNALHAALGVDAEGTNVDAILELMVWDYAFPDTAVSHEEKRMLNPPYTIRFRNTSGLDKKVLEEIQYLRDALPKARAECPARYGHDVDVSLEIVS
jgi:hypothetical protein